MSNGHIGLRGNLDEGEPHGLPGTYLNSFYETRPLPYAEAGYSYPEDGQSLIDVTNGKIMRLLVDDEPFDVRTGNSTRTNVCWTYRAGTLTRDVDWTSPAGKRVKLHTTRLVSLAQRSVAAIEYVVEAVDEFTRITVQSELVANEDQPQPSADPRVAAMLSNPLEAVQHDAANQGAYLVHRTRSSRLMMAAAMEHLIEVPGRVEADTEAGEDWARTTIICDVGQDNSCASSSFWPTGGRAYDRGRRCVTKYLARLQLASTAGGRVWSRLSASAWTSSGIVRMSRWTAMRFVSRRCASVFSMYCRPVRQR